MKKFTVLPLHVTIAIISYGNNPVDGRFELVKHDIIQSTAPPALGHSSWPLLDWIPQQKDLQLPAVEDWYLRASAAHLTQNEEVL